MNDNCIQWVKYLMNSFMPYFEFFLKNFKKFSSIVWMQTHYH